MNNNIITSKKDWEGLHSNKFSLKQKKHYTYGHHDSSSPSSLQKDERRHYPHQLSGEKIAKSSIKLFPTIHNVPSPSKPLRNINELNPQVDTTTSPRNYDYTREYHSNTNTSINTSSANGINKSISCILPSISQNVSPNMNNSNNKMKKQIGQKIKGILLNTDTNDIDIYNDNINKIKARDVLYAFFSSSSSPDHMLMNNKSSSLFDHQVDLMNNGNTGNSNNKNMYNKAILWKQRESYESIQEDEKYVRDLEKWEEKMLRSSLPKIKNKDKDQNKDKDKDKEKDNEKKEGGDK